LPSALLEQSLQHCYSLKAPATQRLSSPHLGPNSMASTSLNEPSSILDLTNHVHRSGEYYFAIGDHSDVWMADLDGEPGKVLKVLRGGSSGNRKWIETLQKLLLLHGETWHHFNHENVSKFYGFSFQHAHMPALVLPYYPKGNIMQYLDTQVPKLSDSDKLQLVRGIARGINYLHGFEPPVVHGDIRGANVLIDEGGRPVLCDYGLAFIIVGSEFTSVKTAGNCRWAAPEVMNPPDLVDPDDDNGSDSDSDEPAVFFTQASDIYSFAMTILEIYSGKPPFLTKRNDSTVVFSVIEGKRPDLPLSFVTHKKLGDLVVRYWDQDPRARPTIKALCNELDSALLLTPSQNEQWIISRSVFYVLVLAFPQSVFGILRQWLPI